MACAKVKFRFQKDRERDWERATVKKLSSHEYAVRAAVCGPPPREILGTPGNSRGCAGSAAAGEEDKPQRRGPVSQEQTDTEENQRVWLAVLGSRDLLLHRPALDLDSGS